MEKRSEIGDKKRRSEREGIQIIIRHLNYNDVYANKANIYKQINVVMMEIE